MRTSLVTAATVAAMVLCGCASTPGAPSNAPPMLGLEQTLGDSNVPYSSVIESVAEPQLNSGPVGVDDQLLSISYRYKHTAVLTEDVVGFSITVSGVQAPKGSPGYYAGTFIGSGGPGMGRPAELWCFMPQVAGGNRESLCLLRNLPGLAAIAPTRMNPYLWTSFAPATGSFDYVRTPIYEPGPIALPVDLVLGYRFGGWTRLGAHVRVYAVGREV